jgi:hypothetical protein
MAPIIISTKANFLTTRMDNSSEKPIFEHPFPIQILPEDVLLISARLMIRDSRGQEFIGKRRTFSPCGGQKTVALDELISTF